jgi:hypothetical protein
VEQRASLLYHDFTGRSVRLLAEYFDAELAPYLDQIVYGLSAREDHGCYFDLTQPKAFFAYRAEPSLNGRPLIKVFNYFKFIVNRAAWNNEEAQFPPSQQHLIHDQKNRLMQDITNRFRNFNIAMLRLIKMQSNTGEEYRPEYLFTHLPKAQQEKYFELWNEHQYDLLYDIIFLFCANQLQIVAQLGEMDISGEAIDAFMPKA